MEVSFLLVIWIHRDPRFPTHCLPWAGNLQLESRYLLIFKEELTSVKPSSKPHTGREMTHV